MEFSIEREELLQGLYLTQGVVERRTTIPILANVLLESADEGVVISATDQEVGVRRTCAATVKKPGALTTGARKLYEIVRECPDGVISVKSLDNNWIAVHSGKSRFKIVGLDPEEFPAMPAPLGDKDQQQPIQMPAQLFREIVERTLFAVSTDETRLNLGGIFLERPEPGKIRAVATDGHRLSMITRDVSGADQAEGVILPRKGVHEILKILEGCEDDLEIALQGGIAHTTQSVVELSMRLVEGEFPDYQQVVPKKSPRVMTLGISDFLAALRRVSVVSSERTRGVKLSLEPGKLEVSSINPDFGEASEEVAVDYSGESFSIGFNSKYVMDVLGVLPGDDQIEMCFADEVSPGVIRSADDPSFLYVVMPMRI